MHLFSIPWKYQKALRFLEDCTVSRICGQTTWTITKNLFAFNENVLKPSAKRLLILFGLTVSVSATDFAIWKETFGTSASTLTISNEDKR